MNRTQELIRLHVSKPGLRGKVNAKCIECIYDEGLLGHGSWRKQVEDCTSVICPLYSVRPTRLMSHEETEEGVV